MSLLSWFRSFLWASIVSMRWAFFFPCNYTAWFLYLFRFVKGLLPSSFSFTLNFFSLLCFLCLGKHGPGRCWRDWSDISRLGGLWETLCISWLQNLHFAHGACVQGTFSGGCMETTSKPKPVRRLIAMYWNTLSRLFSIVPRAFIFFAAVYISYRYVFQRSHSLHGYECVFS